ncbi:hypothetical protein CIRMBP1271_00416 [Enterococcus cecorum]|uniref:hypothetical protein n=1 Tax=Enterococcus cecorum TaxID=44008 RepID=UPI00065A3935|nr:hypothetical protein [Enterococcus cecorum]KLO67526.1 hypothetical protein AA985_01100 [Enterococcus cecorum]CAI3255610.1 hypothetical protein CIRMBP1243_00082 [Enterococcus cecorum]CAI3256270.1 hypothetical protein CIRMBP1217_00069 [Enterococcus cecorum]CAI3256571.1 hypothetical protein CIRMBP1226_00097 [Enterococcus cecorum]CAI3256880.1 hypothetical protein CIRMBP1195_00069 [Enterococcus cecorum]
MTDYAELNRLTDLIDHIDSEMTRIYNKLLEFEYLIEEFGYSKDERFSTAGVDLDKSVILNNRIRYMREYILLSIDLAKLVEKRREILDQKVNDLTKKEKKRMVSKEQLSHEELFMLSPMERDILEKGGKIQL